MALKYYRCKESGQIIKTLKNLKQDLNYEELYLAPNGKFMICSNEATNKSKIKDLDKQLKIRARNHSRDNEIDELIQLNKENKIGVNNFLNNKGERRKKIDDI